MDAKTQKKALSLAGRARKALDTANAALAELETLVQPDASIAKAAPAKAKKAADKAVSKKSKPANGAKAKKKK